MTDTIKPEVGKRYVMRNGEVTGELMYGGHLPYPYYDNNNCWRDTGRFDDNDAQHRRDLISEYIEPAPAPAVDLTKNEKPFGLLDAETQEALKAWEHGVQVFSYDGAWRDIPDPQFDVESTYRAKPAPVKRKPREWFIVLDRHANAIHAQNVESLASDFASRFDGTSVVHVREVIE